MELGGFLELGEPGRNLPLQALAHTEESGIFPQRRFDGVGELGHIHRRAGRRFSRRSRSVSPRWVPRGLEAHVRRFGCRSLADKKLFSSLGKIVPSCSDYDFFFVIFHQDEGIELREIKFKLLRGRFLRSHDAPSLDLVREANRQRLGESLPYFGLCALSNLWAKFSRLRSWGYLPIGAKPFRFEAIIAG